MLILYYTIAVFTISIEEAWNINNPRPNPKKIYYCLNWEEKDFYTQKINNEWVLRKYRKTDSETKNLVRKKYWENR